MTQAPTFASLLLRARVSPSRLRADGSLSESVHLKELGQITSYVPCEEKGRKEVSFSFEKLSVGDLEGQGMINRGSELTYVIFASVTPFWEQHPDFVGGTSPIFSVYVVQAG